MKARRSFLKTAMAAVPASHTPVAITTNTTNIADFTPALFELRSYLCRPGCRDALIAMFEDALLGAYQATGTRIVGTFRCLDDADRWVWIRAFRNASDRGPALKAFYSSAVWKARAGSTNATIRDISPALLLRGAGVAAASSAASAAASAATTTTSGNAANSRFLVEVFPLSDGAEGPFSERFEQEAAPLLASLGARPLTSFITDHSANSFPRQPVRAGAAFVTLTRFADAPALAAFESARSASAAWRERAARTFSEFLAAPPEIHRLQPTARSALH